MSRILTDSYERELQHRHEQRNTTGTGRAFHRSFHRWIGQVGQVGLLVRARRQPRGT
ncbi:hypothetical protein G3I60_09680 [Streptomyces sp. SID13666]|uniref:hypothetical protein n=1 Tax=unclassified Streptomyces TaxID=2593676 RepID=UPI0013C1313C|nr:MULTISPECIES: hypothetical protein [unclassified Streptomyces]NEA54418.1 hypothetical protein [Streptomyces sp. SID13666]NEA72207.1 hypothetical protein [Streptomyces sp. SID13588]